MTHPREASIRVDWLGLWILYSTWCGLSGWGLSALGCLNLKGVCGSIVVLGVALLVLWQPLALAETSGARSWSWLRSGRLMPRFWLAIAGLIFIGGVAYVPNNYDHLTYRFPRLLYWAWEQRWYWIQPGGDRMNYSGTQFEWMMAPLFILFKTDRLFFLSNFVAYLFLPRLVFTVFRGLGISSRVSWWWMWVLPCGYCFVLQAGSVANDAFAATYLLAALHYLFRARICGSVKNLVLSTLAIALMTAAKASNLPLVLPWAVLLFFTRGPVGAKATPVIVILTLMAAAGASFLPIAVLNWRYTGDFFGDPTNSGHLKVNGPIGGIVGNLLQIGSQNMAPPLWYKEVSWNGDVPRYLQPILKQSFPRLDMTIREFPGEEGAAIGMGCTAAAALFLAMGFRARWLARELTAKRGAEGLWITAAVAIAALVYMANIATEAAPRVVTPYYPLVIAGVLVIARLDGQVVRWRLLKWTGLIVMLSAIPMMVLSPSRPLFPAQLVSSYLDEHSSASVNSRFRDVYQVYAARAFAFQGIIPLIPPDDRAVGFLHNGDTAEVSLWRPFGSRKVVDVGPGDTVENLKAEGIHVVVVSQETLDLEDHTDIASLLNKWSAHLLAQKKITLKVQRGGNTWYVVGI